MEKIDEDFWNKQNQIYLFLQYEGFVEWIKIRKVCMSLIESCSNDVKNWYGKYPEYKLFCPLVLNGIVDFALYNNRFGYSLSSRTYLIAESKDRLIYLNHFSLNNCSQRISQELCQRMAFSILYSFPSLEEIIKSWNRETLLEKDYYLKEGLYSTSKNASKINDICIFKKDSSSYSADYITIDKINSYKIPNKTFEDLNIARTYIRMHLIHKKISAMFIYNKSTNELSYEYYQELPIAIYRALILFDVQQLENKELFLPNRNNKSFTRIPEKSLSFLRNIFGKNCIKEI